MGRPGPRVTSSRAWSGRFCSTELALLRHPQGRTGPAAHAAEMFAGLLAEVRAYGKGLVIAEQIPAKLIPDVIKNTAVKIVHRLPAADDRAAVGATMNLTEPPSQYLVTLTPGEAAVFRDGMDYPLLTRMPDGTAMETSTPAVTSSPETLAGRRSPGCGPACQAAACTLRQIRAAERAAETDPRITLWAELSVLAHLTGWTMPMPGTGFAAALRAIEPGAATKGNTEVGTLMTLVGHQQLSDQELDGFIADVLAEVRKAS